MIKEWIEQYRLQNQNEAVQALREIMQEIALAGLQRSGFFAEAAFYGGTALRIFYGLGRFSEDLDFSLLKVRDGFSFRPYLQGMMNEFEAAGLRVSLHEKAKGRTSQVESAFLKSETYWQELRLEDALPQLQIDIKPNIKIKLEVDTRPPGGFETEEKLLLRPFSFYVKCFTLPDLYAGKMHALLFRQWKQRVKGRDWFDFEWYVRRGAPLNLNHFLVRAQDSGHWHKPSISEAEFVDLLINRIDAVSMERIREDVVRFVADDRPLEIWSKDYFKDLSKHIRFLK
jgi:hypothetical protein